ncbi:hemolysin family protein [Cryptosporangium aurantiacum]|uniref:Hemolysin, contains CBS domains n=1 Tax=Cryptosporangium aurantiacum TaxID=134849 RepID=A0A1M7QTX0_9ACTN|nr:hemolysin family protein [Cryptosporangium aurantiacum]SHN35215.1 Hemolysin, contains CBS domains [Cryptosporangium aurantiacum]
MDLGFVLLAFVLLLGNAFFVGAEFALVTTRRDQLEPRVARGSRAARTALYGVEHLSLMLAGAQLGISLCSLGLGAVGEPAVAHLIEGPLKLVHVPEGLLHPIAFVLALTIVSYLHLVLGELVPKNISLAGPVRAALLLGPPMVTWCRITKPAVVSLNATANGILRLFGITPRDDLNTVYTGEEMTELVAESRAEGFLDADAERRLTRALSTEARTAGDVALAGDGLQVVPDGATVREVERLVASSGYSRFPVRGPDGFSGYVHAKDLLEASPDELDGPLPARLIRTMPDVEHDAPLADAVEVLRRSGAHLGLVTESHGVAVVALEDLLEELVGQLNETPPISDRSAPGLAAAPNGD